ncbi:uncharacterized protein LOC141995136 [Natator depressus]|uniref:uncharacterized protein LOC141995136 n=1 Tax=Natator depressus TaxID=27790 RepID=UPI003EBB8220
MQSPPSQETTQSRIRRRAPAWSEQEVLDLIACWGDESGMSELHSKKKKRNANTYAKGSRAMTERGYSRDTGQCCTKIKELRQVYQKAREANGRSGSQPHTCRFYHELHAIMGGDATTTPTLSVDTCKGGVARSGEDEFLEDKEEEEEDSAQAASGESVSPPSQELFLTLEPIASPHSQSMLPDHDLGEGTSGGKNDNVCHRAFTILTTPLWTGRATFAGAAVASISNRESAGSDTSSAFSPRFAATRISSSWWAFTSSWDTVCEGPATVSSSDDDDEASPEEG